MSKLFFKVFSFKSFRPLSKQWQKKKYQEVNILNSRKIGSHVLSTNLSSNTKILSKTSKHLKLIQINSQLNYCNEKKNKIISFSDFEQWSNKNKDTFFETIRIYQATFPNRKGHVEFVESAVKQMENYGVHKDIEAYKKIIDILPKGVFVVKNRLQASLYNYPRQQFAAIELLAKMDLYGVIPDAELGSLLISIFGKYSQPCLKYFEQLYWSTKFKNKSPWFLPKQVPSDSFLLGQMAMERITSVDIQTEISVYQTDDLLESIDKTWIISGQSSVQKKLLNNHPPITPLRVEGGDFVWLRDQFVNYFVLKADRNETCDWVPPKDNEDLLNMQSQYFNPNYSYPEKPAKTVHHQNDGIIFAIAITGTSSKDSLLSWIRFLEKNGNYALKNIPILFKLRTPEKVPVAQ